MGLALACDLVVAADDAQFGTPEIDVGLWPFVITVPLMRSMPPKKALELMMTGRRVGAEEAERIGFVTRVVPVDELDAAVGELAADLATKSPAVMRLGRDSFYAVWDQHGRRRAPPAAHDADRHDGDRRRRRGHRGVRREAPAALDRPMIHYETRAFGRHRPDRSTRATQRARPRRVGGARDGTGRRGGRRAVGSSS